MDATATPPIAMTRARTATAIDGDMASSFVVVATEPRSVALRGLVRRLDEVAVSRDVAGVEQRVVVGTDDGLKARPHVQELLSGQLAARDVERLEVDMRPARVAGAPGLGELLAPPDLVANAHLGRVVAVVEVDDEAPVLVLDPDVVPDPEVAVGPVVVVLGVVVRAMSL